MLGRYEVPEGNSITIGECRVEVKTILNLDTCRVGIRIGNKVKYTKLEVGTATRITETRSIYLQNIQELHIAKLVIISTESVSGLSAATRKIVCKYDIINIFSVVSKAVPIVHKKYTHRSGIWLLNIKRDILVGLTIIRCPACLDIGRLEVFNECQHCLGEKCSRCSGTGLKKHTIRCQENTHLTNYKKVGYSNHSNKEHQQRKKHEMHELSSRH